ncbi:aminopeptidase P family protein [Fournierella massiliensis]|nr:M24 family metallopeptidase [Fournierella massiliensis]MCF2557355.1 aminopeptidase P family protein [Fournierella massiliensis]
MTFHSVHAAQDIARLAMERTAARLRPGLSEAQIVQMVLGEMEALGSEGWWYHGVGALVLVGPGRSLASISGRDYRPLADAVLEENDLVTLDLGPVLNGAWGDYARTVFLEGGRPVLEPQEPSLPAFRQGYQMELRLHKELMDWARPHHTYEEVWQHMNGLLAAEGWQNRDFHGNLGHSIEKLAGERIYLENGNAATLGGYGKPFTFEPHICLPGGEWGFKREQIYAFGPDDRLFVL